MLSLLLLSSAPVVYCCPFRAFHLVLLAVTKYTKQATRPSSHTSTFFLFFFNLIRTTKKEKKKKKNAGMAFPLPPGNAEQGPMSPSDTGRAPAGPCKSVLIGDKRWRRGKKVCQVAPFGAPTGLGGPSAKSMSRI